MEGMSPILDGANFFLLETMEQCVLNKRPALQGCVLCEKTQH